MKIIITEEQIEKINRKIKMVVEKLGLEQSMDLFGKDRIKEVYIENPLSFLNQFNNLKPIKKDGEIYYVDNNNLPLFYYYREDQESKNGFYYINYFKIWLFFEGFMGYDRTEIEEIMEEWLATTYNLRGLTPTDFYRNKI